MDLAYVWCGYSDVLRLHPRKNLIQKLTLNPGPASLQGPVTRRALFDEVADRLRHRIHTQDLLPGQRLDEVELCREFSVSRTPLREALKVLQSEGLVKLVPRRGCFVAEISGKDLADIFSILMVLEEGAAAEAVARMGEADVRRLQRLHQRLETQAAAGNLAGYMDVNRDFHETLYTIAGNRWRDEIIRDLRRIQAQFRYRSLNLPGRLEASMQEHRLLMSAFEKRDAAQAAKLMRQHVENQWRAMHSMSTVPAPGEAHGSGTTVQAA